MKRLSFLLIAVVCALMAQAQVTVPADANIEKWTCSLVMHSNSDAGEELETVEEEMELAFYGQDVYFNLPNPVVGNTWIKGTRNGAVVTFPAGQKLGTHPYHGTFYLVGMDENGLCDIRMNYDEDNHIFTQGYLNMVISSSATEVDAMAYYTDFTVRRDKGETPQEEELVVLPEGLSPQQYVLKATSILYDTDGSVAGMEPVQLPVMVAFKGSTEVYVQGVCDFLPEAWIKGTVDDGYVTFARGQYLGRAGYPVYFCGMFLGTLCDAEFSLENGQLLGGSYYMVINASKTELMPFSVYAGITISKFVETAATPATPGVKQYQPYVASEGYSVLMLNVPTIDVDGNALITSKLGYRLYTMSGGVQSDYVFRKSQYVNLPENEMTIIPYDFTDNFDFYVGGSCIYVADDLSRYEGVGVQSVYTGAGETRQSQIAWYQLGGTPEAINIAKAPAVVSETLTDLQGRKAENTRHGLLIRTQRMSDGSVRIDKIWR